MLILLSLVLSFVGILLFSFVIWKRLREDYTNDQIYLLSFALFICALGARWIASNWFIGFEVWFVVVACAGALNYLLKRLGIKFFEFVDALAPATFYFLFFWYLGKLVLGGKDQLLIIGPQVLLSFAMLFIYQFLLSRYRKFSWYPSGKVGFAGLASFAIYSLFRSILVLIKGLTAQTGQDMINTLDKGRTALSFPANSGSSIIGLLPGFLKGMELSDIVNVFIGLVMFGVLVYLIRLRSGKV